MVMAVVEVGVPLVCAGMQVVAIHTQARSAESAEFRTEQNICYCE